MINYYSILHIHLDKIFSDDKNNRKDKKTENI